MPRSTRKQIISVLSWLPKPVKLKNPQMLLKPFAGNFYSMTIGYSSLKRLGFRISFKRTWITNGFNFSEYHLVPFTTNVQEYSSVFQVKRTKGLLFCLPRGIKVTILLEQLPRNGKNIPMHRFQYKLHSVFITKGDKTIDTYIIRRQNK